MKYYDSVHQFHSGAASGDAITNQMLSLRSHLRNLGFKSDIFAEHVDPGVSRDVRYLSDYSCRGHQLLLWHHSMGNNAVERLISLPHDIAVVYHNVTPSEFFEEPTAKYYSELGLAQLQILARRSKAALADSNFNRIQLLQAGARRVAVLPPVFNLDRFQHRLGHPSRRNHDWLFVGRIVPNKGHIYLARAFAEFRKKHSRSSRLVLAGDLSYEPYVRQVQAETVRLGISNLVWMPGKVSEAELVALMQTSGVYVSLSDHEGFGVPLLEAMAAGLPVVALASTAVAETMGGAGVLLSDKEPAIVASRVSELLGDWRGRRSVIAGQLSRISKIQSVDTKRVLTRLIAAAGGDEAPIEVQVQGPFETSYSLAITNRQVALGLDGHGGVDVSIFPTEGPGDYTPKPADLVKVPEAWELYRKADDVPYPEVVIRQTWPPRLADSPGGVTIAYFHWEESAVPADIVRELNDFSDAVAVPSRFVETALRRSGVSVPIAVVGNEVRVPETKNTCGVDEVKGLRGFRFLHVSSGFPRKGVDVLLRAYFEAFSGDSDVSLVLKTFPNPHNEVGRVLDALRRDHRNPPDVRWIDRDLDVEEIDGLYALADCYVHPARGEGFGLPVAEAMLADVPVIAPASSGLADFVDDSTARTISFRLEKARTHLATPSSMWAEPDRGELGAAMKEALLEKESSITSQRTARARQVVASLYSRDQVAQRWLALIEQARARKVLPSLAMVTSWNSRCGIAEYSRYLSEALPAAMGREIYADVGADIVDNAAERGVMRCWTDRFTPDLRGLQEVLDVSQAEVVHFQFNFGFFELSRLGALIESQATKRGVVVTLHRTKDITIADEAVSLRSIAGSLACADALIVHQSSDVERLASFGLTSNVRLIQQGNLPPLETSTEDIRRQVGFVDSEVVATFGFLLPHKGLLRLIDLVDKLREARPRLVLVALSAAYPGAVSAEYERTVRREIERRRLQDRVILITDFLDDELVRTILRGADVIALPYDPTEESASASGRMVISAARPTVVSKLSIFADVADCTLQVVPGDELGLEVAISSVLQDAELGADLAARAASKAAENSWGMAAQAHLEVYREAAENGRQRRTDLKYQRRVKAACS